MGLIDLRIRVWIKVYTLGIDSGSIVGFLYQDRQYKKDQPFGLDYISDVGTVSDIFAISVYKYYAIVQTSFWID